MQLCKQELEIAYELKKRLTGFVQPEQFMRLIDKSPNQYSIVYTPSGVPIGELNSNRLEQMFECVEKLQQFGVIHRDLTPHHFLKRTYLKDGIIKEQVCAFFKHFSSVFNLMTYV